MVRSRKSTTINTEGVSVSIDELVALHGQAKNLGLNPRRRILSLQAGGFASPFRGRGMEFSESRAYQPGDDIRTIDWRVTARSGQTHTKLFREERERPVLLVVDQSASMVFGTRVAFKSVVAARAAALLAWAGADNGDRVGAIIFDEDSHTELRPARGKRGALALVRSLCKYSRARPEAQEGHQAAWISALARANRIAHPGTFVIIVSDFHNPTPDAQQQLTLLNRHNDVLQIFVYDPLEKQLPPPGQYGVTDGDSVFTLDTTQRALFEKYHARFLSRREVLETWQRKLGTHLIELSTEQPLVDTLRRSLAARNTLPRRRERT